MTCSIATAPCRPTKPTSSWSRAVPLVPRGGSLPISVASGSMGTYKTYAETKTSHPRDLGLSLPSLLLTSRHPGCPTLLTPSPPALQTPAPAAPRLRLRKRSRRPRSLTHGVRAGSAARSHPKPHSLAARRWIGDPRPSPPRRQSSRGAADLLELRSAALTAAVNPLRGSGAYSALDCRHGGA